MSTCAPNIHRCLRGLFVCLIGALVLASCSQPQQPAQPLSGFTIVRAALDSEWRDAIEIPAGEVRVSLGPAPKGSAVRLGVLPATQDKAQVEVRVGRWKIAAIAAADYTRWHDKRMGVGISAWGGGKECVLICRSAGGMRLGPCELIAPGQTRPNVLMVVLDTVRQDHLSCYGYPEPTSPAIDRLATDGILFRRLMPQSTWTRPSIASLLTSAYPPAHGAEQRNDPVRPGLPDLADALNKQGYVSIGVVTNPNCLPVWGLGNGFDQYVSFSTAKASKQANDVSAVDAIMDGIANAAGRPWFAYVHLMAAHRPYSAPQTYSVPFQPDKFVGTRTQRRIQQDLVRYDGEIACVDEQVGRLVDFLKRAGSYDDTLIVLLADHGEQFFEHGDQGHGVSLHDEELNVPLIVKLPGNAKAGEQRQALVEMVDVAPTVLDVLGLNAEPQFQGRSFAAIIQQDRWESRAGFASLRLDGKSQRAVKSRIAKCTVDDIAGHTYWFDLEHDPDELQPFFRPIGQSAHFDEFAARMSVEGAPGLHVLIRPGASSQGTVNIRATVSNPAGFKLFCPADAGDAAANGSVVEATVDLSRLAQKADELALIRSDWTPHAHLVIPVGSEESVTVAVERDGQPVAQDQVFIGRDGRHDVLNGQPLNVGELACDTAKPPAPTTDSFSVCLWMIPATGPVDPESLTEDVTEALNALGYLQ